MLLVLQPEMLSPSRTNILSGFLRAMLAPFGVEVRLSYGHVGAILGPISATLGLCSRLYGIISGMLPRHCQKQPKDTPPKRSPEWPSRRSKIHTKNQSKTEISSKTLTCMAVKAKRNQKSTQNPPSKRSLQWPCSLHLLRGRQNKGPPPSKAI